MLRINPLFLLILSLVLLTSCSSGSQSLITSPTEINQPGDLLVGVSERFSDGSPASGMGALGVFNLSVNADEISAELTPIRQNTLTDILEVVDITNFLIMAPCTDCVKLGLISIDTDGNLVVSIGIKHPFPAGDILKPISGRNRGDLHVFNIEGTIVSDLTGTSFPGLGSTTAGFTLVNADGYTPYLDSVLDDIYPTDATAHQYILHFDDYTAGNFDASNPMGFDSVTDPPPSGNLVMAMGCDYDYQDYVFDINGIVNFIYAVGCTYAVSSASKTERFSPEYRVPQHLKKAASEVSIEVISNDLKGEDALSTAEIEIHVVDISHGVAVGTNLDKMFADSSVGGIIIEIPGVETSPVIVDISSPTGTGHDPSDPLVYAATITNTASGVEGTYTGLVKVVDSYSPGLNENPLLSGMDGIKRVEPIETPLAGLFNISEFATYATFEIAVAFINGDPIADLIPLDMEINQWSKIVWDATASIDPDGTIVQYEWDYEIADGLEENFTPDASTMTPVCTQESVVYDTTGDYYAAVRVTDNLNATDIAVVGFTVLGFSPTYWTQYMHNKNHDGYTNLTGPQTNNVAWTWESPGTFPLNVIEGYDGTIYFGSGSNGGRIHAINPDGTEKWTHQISIGANYCMPAGITSDDSTLYLMVSVASFDGRIMALDTTTQAELWIYNGFMPCSSFCLVTDDDLIVPLYFPMATVRLDRDGNVVWSKPGSTWCSAPAQGPDGTIYIEDMPYIYGVNPDNGNTIYSYYYGSNHQTCIAIRSDGTVICNTEHSVRCCDAQLNHLWTLPISHKILEGSGIGPNGEIYFTTLEHVLYAIAADGSHIDWTWSGSGPTFWCSPAVDADGTIYIGSDGGVDAINPDGTTKWSYSTNGYGGSPIIAHDGSLYVNISSVLHKIADS